MTPLAGAIAAVLREVLGDGSFGLHEPRFTGNERRYLDECIESTFVSSVGPFVDRFEAELAACTGARHAVVVVNGTAALHMALLLAGVERDDEVIVPSLSFAATAAAVRHAGAQPHFADVEADTLGLDAAALDAWLRQVATIEDGHCMNRRTGRRIRALVPMHAFGHPCAMEPLLALARDWHLALVEDAAESLGSTRDGRHTGTSGLLGALSFNGNKIATTGGGGAILTDDPALARRARHLTTTAKVPHPWRYVHDEVGYNYRMPNLNAALGCAQLESLPQALESKRRLFERYAAAFATVPGVRLLAEPDGCRSNYWLQALLLDTPDAAQLEDILATTNGLGLATRPVWTPLHTLAPYRDCPAAPLPVTLALAQRIVNLPSSAGLA